MTEDSQRMRKVGVEKGVEWIGEGFRILRRYPTEFLLMGLIYTAISLVPYGFGLLVIFFLGPALLGGIIHASRSADSGQKPQVSQLFQAFKDGDRVGSYIALCLPALAFVVILIAMAIPIVSAIGHALPSGDLDPQSASDRAAMLAAMQSVLPHITGRLLLFIVVMIVFGFIGGMLTFLASARIMLDGDRAFAAMGASFRACARNFGAYFILMLLIVFGVFMVQVLLSQVLPRTLVVLFTAVPLNSLLGPIVFSAHRSIFGEHVPARTPDEPTPPGPSSHTLEA
jgi:hypothetical protein